MGKVCFKFIVGRFIESSLKHSHENAKIKSIKSLRSIKKGKGPQYINMIRPMKAKKYCFSLIVICLM